MTKQWGWTGGPQPPLPSTLPPLPYPSPRFPSPSPHFPPLEYFSRPIEKNRSSHHMTFHFMQCMDYYQSFKTIGQFVCLFLRSFVSLFWSFTTYSTAQSIYLYILSQPRKEDIRTVDNIVDRSSRVRRENEKKKEDRIDERENARTAGPCPTITQNNKMSRHCKLSSTIVRPNRQL